MSAYSSSLCLACAIALSASWARADQLQMQNGDHYVGKILSVTSNTVVLQSEILGKVTLPRDKVSSLTFGSSAATSATPSPAAPPASASLLANTDIATALRSLGANTNFIDQVRQQMLTGADPAATQKYDEMVNGLMAGKVNVNDLRKEANSCITQINNLKQELGPEAGDSLDSYLTLLQSFVNETASEAPPPSPAKAPVSAAPPAQNK